VGIENREVRIENPTRRSVLASIAAALLGGSLTEAQAQHVHDAVSQVRANGPYKPKLLTDHEYATVQRLAELIIPADDVSPSAVEAGAPEFIDLLASGSPEMARIYTGGIGWLDHEMEKRYGSAFVTAQPAQQTAMLDLIAYRKTSDPGLAPGIEFFDWARKMVVDAFYTSPIGVKDVGYMGNKGMTTFEVPTAAIDYALKRSGL
jgi:gluconate 2-dehydrogenase gamma chain